MSSGPLSCRCTGHIDCVVHENIMCWSSKPLTDTYVVWTDGHSHCPNVGIPVAQICQVGPVLSLIGFISAFPFGIKRRDQRDEVFALRLG